MATKTALARLPSVDQLLRLPQTQLLINRLGLTFVTHQTRSVLSQLRTQLRTDPTIRIDSIDKLINERCAIQTRTHIRRVINMSGTVLHTNLGRAVLPEAALPE